MEQFLFREETDCRHFPSEALEPGWAPAHSWVGACAYNPGYAHRDLQDQLGGSRHGPKAIQGRILPYKDLQSRLRAGINTNREPPQSVLAVSTHLWLCNVCSSSVSSQPHLGRQQGYITCFVREVKTLTLVSWLNLLFWSILLLPSQCSEVSSGGNPPTPGQVRASIHWSVAEHTFPCIPSLWHSTKPDMTQGIFSYPSTGWVNQRAF